MAWLFHNFEHELACIVNCLYVISLSAFCNCFITHISIIECLVLIKSIWEKYRLKWSAGKIMSNCDFWISQFCDFKMDTIKLQINLREWKLLSDTLIHQQHIFPWLASMYFTFISNFDLKSTNNYVWFASQWPYRF